MKGPLRRRRPALVALSLLGILAASAVWSPVRAVGKPGGQGLIQPAWRAGTPVVVSGPVPGVGCSVTGDDASPTLARDPAHPGDLVSTYVADTGGVEVDAESTDEGQTWTRRPIPGLTSCTAGPDGQIVDPSLFVTTGGVRLASSGWTATGLPALGLAPATGHDGNREYVSGRSATGGWSAPADVEADQPDQRGYMAELNGALYLETERAAYFGTFVPGLGSWVVLRSNDDGRSWSPTRGTPPQLPAGQQPFAAGLLRTGGRLVALVEGVEASTGLVQSLSGQPIAGILESSVSDDGGHTWSPLSVIATCGGCLLPGSAVAPDGSVIVSFVDRSSQVLRLARSTDGGRSWAVHRIGPVNAVDNDLSAVAVTTDGRSVGVLYLGAETAQSPLYDARLASSSDGGATWADTIVAGPFDSAAYTDTSSDTPTGSSLGLVPIANGFEAVFTAIGPITGFPGQSHVDAVSLSRLGSG